jgi:hypothetical protein
MILSPDIRFFDLSTRIRRRRQEIDNKIEAKLAEYPRYLG